MHVHVHVLILNIRQSATCATGVVEWVQSHQHCAFSMFFSSFNALLIDCVPVKLWISSLELLHCSMSSLMLVVFIELLVSEFESLFVADVFIFSGQEHLWPSGIISMPAIKNSTRAIFVMPI